LPFCNKKISEKLFEKNVYEEKEKNFNEKKFGRESFEKN